MTPPLVLFDVDRTLISRARSHRIAFVESMQEVYGIDPTNSGVQFHGMTDPQIVIEVLRARGVGEKEIERGLNRCLQRMTEVFLEHLPTDSFEALDGAISLVTQLSESGAHLGLVTGNLEAIAWKKLERVGLREFFKVGGFGSDDRNRATLVGLAVSRAEALFGPSGKIWVAGDTPRDIVAAKAAGVESVGVASGVYSVEDLAEAGADFVCSRLSDPDVAILLCAP